MSAGVTYLVDSDVLITAKNRYYAFDICPGFWECLLDAHTGGRLFSIDSVRRELLNGWLVAYAHVHDMIIATNELANPEIKREVKLGNVCQAFDVAYEDTFDMLRGLQACFGYRQSGE